MLQEGVIRPSSSPFSSPIHVVPKKDNTWRVVGDYRKLNSYTQKDSYSLPYINDFATQLHGKTIFTRLDLKNAYHQIPINETDIPKTAISTPFGNYEFLKMNFGLCGASQTFQRYIDSVLWDLKTDDSRAVTFFAYVDDILIASANEEEHYQDIDAILARLSANGLKLNPTKCEIGMQALEFLGHAISREGMRPLNSKIDAITQFVRPETLTGLRRFLGMLNYYRKFIPHAAGKLAVLFSMIASHAKRSRIKNPPLIWTDETNAAFVEAKTLLAESTLLTYPIPEARLHITSDASAVAIGAVLQQTYENNTTPIAFFSAKLSRVQQKFSTFGRELLSIYLAVKHFRRYVEGRDFIIYTDHKPIIRAMLKHDRDIARETRQLQYISQFTTNIQHIAGTKNDVADTLSRMDTELIDTEMNEQSVATEVHEPQQEGLEISDEESILACDQRDNPIDTVTPASEQYLQANFTHALEEELRFETQHDTELQAIIAGANSISVKLENHDDIYYERVNDILRPYIPRALRERIFHSVHDIAHPGAKTTLKQVRERFFWPSLNKDIKAWARTCINCQKAKVNRHNIPQVPTIEPPNHKFKAIHIDIVGPLPSCQNNVCILTIIDRFSRWTEAIPLPNMTAETVSKALITHWISRYGTPERIVSDRGSNFESYTFSALSDLLGVHKIRTTAYHPQSNSVIERFHRRLKEALKASADADPTNWVDKIPLIMLSLRSATRADGQPAPAQVLYGCNLRLPIDLLVKNDSKRLYDVSQYTDKLIVDMQAVGPIMTRQCHRPSYVDPHLSTCKYVFVRNEVKRPLRPAYNGPFKVLERHDTYFKINLHNRIDNVHIQRLKAAYTEEEVLSRNTPDVRRYYLPTPDGKTEDRSAGNEEQTDGIPEPSIATPDPSPALSHFVSTSSSSSHCVPNPVPSSPSHSVPKPVPSPELSPSVSIPDRNVSPNFRVNATPANRRLRHRGHITINRTPKVAYINRYGGVVHRPPTYCDEFNSD